MKNSISLIIIGTELTRGIIADTHAQFIGREVAHLGYHMDKIVAIPDDGTITPILHARVRESSVVLVTGGLGPTTDDMTRSAIADTAGVRLVKNQSCWDKLYARVGERIHGANEKQAYIPEGFTPIANPNGTADGFYGTSGEALVVAMPGPPREMRPLFLHDVLPLLASRIGVVSGERDEYSVFLVPESILEDLTRKAGPDLEWGDRFQDFRISLYLSGGDKSMRDAAIARLQAMTGTGLVEKGDTEAVGLLVSLLKELNASISCAESCTGGYAAKVLTDKAGASDYFFGSVTSYAYSVKEKVLGVDPAIIARDGAVSTACASAMAEGVRTLLGSDYAFSVTGVAGPDKSEGKDVGTVCFGFAGKGRQSESVCVHLTSYGRDGIRRRAVVVACLLMRAFIRKEALLDIVSSWSYI